MSGLFNIAGSALRANQQGLAAVSQNIANVNTEGFGRQQVRMSSGVGGNVTAEVERSYSAWAENALTDAQSSFGASQAKSNALDRLESFFSVGEGSLASAFARLQDAFSDLAAAPNVRGVRAAALEEARTVASRFQGLDRQLANLDRQLEQEVQVTVDRINRLTGELADLNRGLSATGESSGLLDLQSQLLSELALELGVRSTRRDDGQVDLFLPSGQALVRGAERYALSAGTATEGPFANRLSVEGSSRDASFGLTGGRLAGLFEAREDSVVPLRRQLDRLAIAFSAQSNGAQQAGFTAAGAPGTDLFSVGLLTTQGRADPDNAGNAELSVNVDQAEALEASAYELTFDGADATVRRIPSGDVVFLGPPGDLSNQPLDGLTFTLDAGALAAGDRYRFEPLSGAAARIETVLEDPEGLALNRASFTPALVDFGGAVPPDFSLSLPEPQALTAPLPTPLVLTVVDVAGDLVLDDGNGARYPFVLDQALTLAPYGLEMTISGTPAAGDQISLTAQSAGGADGGQAQLLAEDRALLEDGTTAAEGYGSLLGFAAAASNRAGLQLEAAEVSRVDAQEFRDAQAGVNLDEEAADLLRYQQAYQAAARIINTADTLFQSILSIGR